MANSYAQLQDIKDRIIRDLAAQQTQLTTATGAFTAIKNNLTAFQSLYTTWATEVDALATANPTDAAIMALKAERDLLVSEFASTKTDAEAYETAVNGV
jgi:hypothetical protein